MWTALFIVVVAFAIGFVLLAAWLSPQVPNVAPHRKDRWPLMRKFVEGCRELSRAVCTGFEPKWLGTNDGTDSREANLSDTRYDPATGSLREAPLLLLRRMKFLHINPDRLARSEPLLFQRLTVRCRQCESSEQCARDLDRASMDSFSEDWKQYCLNVSLLGMLSAIESIENTSTTRGAGPISPPGDDTGGSRH